MGHTPGPWARYQRLKVVAVVADDGTDREVIHWSGFDSSDFPHDSRANARLIAKAPEMLQALKDARRYVAGAYECAFPDSDENAAVLTAIDVLIAEAEGAQ